MRARVWLWLGLVMIGGTLVACVPARQPTAGEIVAQMLQAEAQVKDYHAVVETVLAGPDSGERIFVQEIWRKDPDLLRTEVREGPAEMVGQVTVFNGERVWFYDPHLNRVQILPVETPFQLPERDMAAAMWATAEELLRESTANYLAEEVAAGRKAHKVQLIPQPGTDLFAALGGKPITVWIDQEHARRLKMDVSLLVGGHYTMQYRAIEYNVGLPDSLFQFTPPPGAKVVTEEGMPPWPDRQPPAVEEMGLAEAQGAAGFPLLLPTYLPAGMSFAQARVVEGGSSVTLIYAGGQGSLTITEGQARDVELPDIGQEMSLRGTMARLQQQGDRSLSLRWQEDGLVIFITGAISQEEALEIARSMK